MDNRVLLDQQLERLIKVNRDIAASQLDLEISIIKSKRSQLVRRIYADLYKQARYRKAVCFLADDLLGDSNLAKRGTQLRRAKSAMANTLPGSLLKTVASSVEFTATTLELEYLIACCLRTQNELPSVLDDERYAACIRESVARTLLETQMKLIVEIGQEIESVVRKPFVSTALKMCRKPAQLMGLGDLQDFLERGFNAFRSMDGAHEFIQAFQVREASVIEKIYTSKEDPFSVT